VSTDPRLAAIGCRLREVGRIVAVTGGKGGIGKSLVASMLAATLARGGRRVGLLDLDLTGPCDHLILGAAIGFPSEEFGIDPHEVHGVRFMSVASFGADVAVPLRGGETTDALIELLAITRWGELEILVIDMPPGLGDTTLDTVRLIGRAEFLVLTTPSLVVLETVRRTLGLLARTGSDMLGVVQNMTRDSSERAQALSTQAGIPFLGTLPFDGSIEPALGDIEKLLSTAFADATGELAHRVFGAGKG